MLNILIIILPLLAVPLQLSAQDRLSAATTVYDEVPEEVVIKGASEDKIKTIKPPLKIKTDNFESINKSLGPDRELFLSESGDFMSLSRSYPERLFSNKIIQPWRAGFSDKNVIAFYPRKKFEEVFKRTYNEKTAKEAQWTLSVTDEEGKIFHKYSGSGLPPENISWDGENDQREWLRAGHSYASVYMFMDDRGAPKTVIGEIIKFTAIVYQKDDKLNISLDSISLFGVNKAAKTIEKPQGEALLAATADLIKRRYYNVPLKVNVYAQNKDLAIVQAALIQNFLKRELMAGDNIITSEGLEDSFAQQRVEIVLLNK